MIHTDAAPGHPPTVAQGSSTTPRLDPPNARGGRVKPAKELRPGDAIAIHYGSFGDLIVRVDVKAYTQDDEPGLAVSWSVPDGPIQAGGGPGIEYLDGAKGITTYLADQIGRWVR